MEYNIANAECLEHMADLPDGKFDMVLADLPYGTTNCKWDTVIDLGALWKEYSRLSSGPVVLFAQTPFDKVLGASNLKELRYEWIWEKTSATGHLNAKKMPMKAHENILVFYKNRPTYNPQKTCNHIRKAATKKGDGSEIYGTQRMDGLRYDSTERYPRSVITFKSDKQLSNLHPTQKPVDLCRYMIRTYTNPGDVVLDNTMGSGTTGVAAIAEGRGFYGIEIDPDYFSIAEDRILEATKMAGKYD